MPNFHFGYLLPTRGVVVSAKGESPDTTPIITLAKKAENLDFDSVWIGDSVLAKPRMESFTTWSAVLASTKKVQVGTAVLLAALRHPIMLTQSLTTLDCMLMSQRNCSFSGKHFSFENIDLEPRPFRKGGPPIWIASNYVQSGLRRVARLADGWITNSITPELYRKCWDTILAY